MNIISAYVKNIVNKHPIISKYGVNQQHFDTDEYYKASNMLQIIRLVINDDEKFRQILRGLNKQFYHQTVTTDQIETYINNQSGIDFSKLFDQYLRHTEIPVLEYKFDTTSKKHNSIYFGWTNCVGGFNLPIKISTSAQKMHWLPATTDWRSLDFAKGEFDGKTFIPDPNFYIFIQKRD